MRLVLFLNGSRGVATLHALIDLPDLAIAAVVITEGTAENVTQQIVDIGVAVIRTKDINSEETSARLKEIEADIFMVCGFPQIFKRDLLLIPRLGVFNQHAGKLPEYRGGSPLNWQIINGEKKIGLSLIKMDDGIDTGDVVAKTEFDLHINHTIADVHKLANNIFSKLTVGLMDSLVRKNGLDYEKQNESKASYWHQRTAEDGKVDLKTSTALQVFNLVRALYPIYPAAFVFKNNSKVEILRVRIPSNIVVRGVPGRVVIMKSGKLFLICKDRALEVVEYKIDSGFDDQLLTGDILT